MNSDVYRRVENRLRDALQLGDGDVDGVLTILHEEFDPIDHTLEEWACDRCGKHKSTAIKGDEKLCNPCIFDDRPIEQTGDSS